MNFRSFRSLTHDHRSSCMKRTNNLALGLAAAVILASLPAEAAGLFDDFARTFSAGISLRSLAAVLLK
jgi:hypothetical protein